MSKFYNSESASKINLTSTVLNSATFYSIPSPPLLPAARSQRKVIEKSYISDDYHCEPSFGDDSNSVRKFFDDNVDESLIDLSLIEEEDFLNAPTSKDVDFLTGNTTDNMLQIHGSSAQLDSGKDTVGREHETENGQLLKGVSVDSASQLTRVIKDLNEELKAAYQKLEVFVNKEKKLQESTCDRENKPRYQPIAIEDVTRWLPNSFRDFATVRNNFTADLASVPNIKYLGNKDYNFGSYKTIDSTFTPDWIVNYQSPITLVSEQKSPYKHDYGVLVNKVIQNDFEASKSLQEQLKFASNIDRTSIISTVISNFDRLSCHRFGNFLIQMCLQSSERLQLASFTSLIIENSSTLCQDKYGHHVVSEMLQYLSHCDLRKIMIVLFKGIHDTFSHCYGSRIWIKLIKLDKIFPNEILFTRQVDELLVGRWFDILVCESGSNAAETLLDNCDLVQLPNFSKEVSSKLHALICNVWGSISVQKLIEKGDPFIRNLITEIVINHSVLYSTFESSSKVLATLLAESQRIGSSNYNPGLLQIYVNRICGTGSYGEIKGSIFRLANNKFGVTFIEFIFNSGSEEQKQQVSKELLKSSASSNLGSKWGSMCYRLLTARNSL